MLLSVLLWYGALVVVGLGSWPLLSLALPNFPDRGYALAKTAGLFLVSYLTWLTASVGLTHFSRRHMCGLLAGYLLLNVLLALKQRRALWTLIRRRWLLLIGLELLFLLVFLTAVVIRMYNPDLTGAEKEADFMMLNAVLHSDAFPPPDTWFAGAALNYYYFGYVIWATMLKVTGIAASVGFNLALATIAGLSAVGSFGLVYALTQRAAAGLLAAFLLTICGNLDGLVQIQARGWHLLPFDWWRSSRVIPDTINEFPYFSFLLGDLHAHFMAIPFLLLVCVLLVQLAETLSAAQRLREAGLIVLLVGLTVGGSAVINGWDAPTTLLLTAGAVLTGLWRRRAERWPRKLMLGAGLCLVLGLLTKFLFWPFALHFNAQMTIRQLRLVDATQRTTLLDFFVIYGILLWGLAPFALAPCAAHLTYLRRVDRQTWLVWLNSVLLTGAVAYACQTERVLLLTATLSAICTLTWIFACRRGDTAALGFFLLAAAFVLVAGCEVIYLQDFYGHPLERQNTVFKFTYQAWVLLSIGIPCLLAATGPGWARLHWSIRRAWQVGGVILCGLGCLYPVLATYEKTNHFRSAENGGAAYLPTLDGLAYVAARYPDEYAALHWIQQHVEPQAVILEATGAPYSFFGRVAGSTGRPTVLGWGNHEALWRDQTWQSIMARQQEIEAIYNAFDKRLMRDLLAKYQVAYVYVGVLERETYNAAGLAAFAANFPIAYANAGVTIYQVAEK